MERRKFKHSVISMDESIRMDAEAVIGAGNKNAVEATADRSES
jgi:hypothetical protein